MIRPQSRQPRRLVAHSPPALACQTRGPQAAHPAILTVSTYSRTPSLQLQIQYHEAIVKSTTTSPPLKDLAHRRTWIPCSQMVPVRARQTCLTATYRPRDCKRRKGRTDRGGRIQAATRAESGRSRSATHERRGRGLYRPFTDTSFSVMLPIPRVARNAQAGMSSANSPKRPTGGCPRSSKAW